MRVFFGSLPGVGSLGNTELPSLGGSPFWRHGVESKAPPLFPDLRPCFLSGGGEKENPLAIACHCLPGLPGLPVCVSGVSGNGPFHGHGPTGPG